jgi:hypothetical protein
LPLFSGEVASSVLADKGYDADYIVDFKRMINFYSPTLGGLKPPPFRRQLQHFFFFTFGSYDAYGNMWSARPSSEIS